MILGNVLLISAIRLTRR